MTDFITWRIYREGYELGSHNIPSLQNAHHKPTRLTVKARTEKEARAKMRQKLLPMQITGLFSVEPEYNS